MTRTEAREIFMTLLFQMEATKDYPLTQAETFFQAYPVAENQRNYCNALVDIVRTHLREIDETLNAKAAKWQTNRMPKADLAVLRLAVGEIFYLDDVSDATAVDEAVKLGKKFGTDQSPKFINGVLGKILREKQDKEG